MLFIPFDIYESIGGPTTFMRNLKIYMDAGDARYRAHYEPGDSIFFVADYDLRELKRVKRNGGLVIQRLDGVYYSPYHAKKYLKANRPMRVIYLDYADIVVFQSDYCRLQCEKILGERGADVAAADRIIHNGVDQDIFSPRAQPLDAGEFIEFVVSGNFRRPETLKPILDALDSLRGKFEFRLHICGPVKGELAALYTGKPWVIAHGTQNLRYVAKLLKCSHIYLFSNINPPCPNSVLEAAACGLPVVSFDSGSLAELLPFSRNLLARVGGEIIQDAKDFHFELLADKIALSVENLPEFQTIARAHANDFAFSKCGESYMQVFSHVDDENFLDARRRHRATPITKCVERFKKLYARVKSPA